MKLTTNVITLGFSKIFNIPLLLLETILLGRILGPDGFGQWTLLLAAATVLHTILINWTHSITVRFGCEEWVARRSLSNTLNMRWPLLIGGWLIILVLIFDPFQLLVHVYRIGADQKWLVLLITIMLWLTFEAQAYLQAKSKITLQAILTPTISFLGIIVLCLIAVSTRAHAFIWIITAICLTKALSWGVTALNQLRRAKLKIHFERKGLEQALFYGWPILPSLALGYVSDWGDHILLSWFRPLEEVGLWSASYQMMTGIISLNSIFVTVLLPWLISNHQSNKNISKFYLNDVVPTIISLGLLFLIGIIMALPEIFNWFMGDKYKNAESILLILNIAILTNLFSSLYSILFALQNRLSKTLFYNLLLVIINLGISVLLIPVIGLKGAALGTVISYVVVHMIYILDQHYFLKVSIWKMGSLFLSAVLVGVLIYLVGKSWQLRMIGGMSSLCLIILIIRQMRSVQPFLIQRAFQGVTQPIGIVCHKLLVRKAPY